MPIAYLSPAIFEWRHFNAGGSYSDQSKVRRSYALVRHADKLIEAAPTEFAIADAVMNLKRAINIRLQLLEANYSFSAAFPRTVGALERLKAVDLARPYLIKELFSLRNDIEHEDAPPPDLNRCRELVDLTWYFLKSTDAAAKLISDALEYECLEDGYAESDETPGLFFTAKLVSVAERKFEISGWFAPPFLLEKEGGLLIRANVVREKPTKRLRGTSIDASITNRHYARRESERWIQGDTIVPQDILCKFWQNVFS